VFQEGEKDIGLFGRNLLQKWARDRAMGEQRGLYGFSESFRQLLAVESQPLLMPASSMGYFTRNTP
jgi:hypothetical protein